MTRPDPKGSVSNEYLDDAVSKILDGVDKMFKEEHKFNAKRFASKEDLKSEVSFVRQDIDDLRSEIATAPTREEFNKFKLKLNKYLPA